MKTHHEDQQIIVPPKNGWQPQAYYLVEVAMNSNNPVFGAIFYTGFIGDNGIPCGYNEIGFLDEKVSISNVRYIRAIKLLASKLELDKVPLNFETIGINPEKFYKRAIVEIVPKPLC